VGVNRQCPPGLRGFYAFTEALGVELAPFQKRIARAVLTGPERETAVLLPRGCAKTSTAALFSLHHLLVTPKAAVHIGAASRDQARICFEILRDHARHPAVSTRVVLRHLEVRAEEGAVLRVLASDGPRAHGLSSSFMVLDELWCHKDDGLLAAMETGLVKRPDSRLLVISTAAAVMDSPLGRMRQRALAGDVKRGGAFIDARAEGLRWLEWSLPDDADPTDIAAVKECNPAPWISAASLREQRARCTPLAFEQFHANRWASGEGAWLPPGAFAACVGKPEFEPGERVWVGIDVGGERSDTAVCWINERLHAGCAIFEGDEGVLEAAEEVRELATKFAVVEVVFDPFRFTQAALELEHEGLRCVKFPQSDTRMCPASDRLYRAITEHRITLPPDPKLRTHAANAIARHTRRGWRLDKAERSANIDGVVALCMALERAEVRPEPVQLLGWL
jgi:phage terminase large subunit-like protein